MNWELMVGGRNLCSCFTNHFSLRSSLLTPTALGRLFMAAYLGFMAAYLGFTAAYLGLCGFAAMVLVLAVAMAHGLTGMNTLLQINSHVSVHARENKLGVIAKIPQLD